MYKRKETVGAKLKVKVNYTQWIWKEWGVSKESLKKDYVPGFFKIF